MKYTKEELKEHLQTLLDECLESMNQEGGMKIKDIDTKTMSGTAEFKFHVDEDGHVEFSDEED